MFPKLPTIEQRVAQGAAWLDENYPNWWQIIDLSTFNINSCHECVLGQMYNLAIPDSERGDLVAQVVAKAPSYRKTTFAENLAERVEGGYHVLVEHHDLTLRTEALGFSGIIYGPFSGWTWAQQMRELGEEWTRVIIGRRLDTHPDIRALTRRVLEAVGS